MRDEKNLVFVLAGDGKPAAKLKDPNKEKNLSKDKKGRWRIYFRCTGRQVRRWLEEEAVPNYMSRLAIRRGIRRMKKIL